MLCLSGLLRVYRCPTTTGKRIVAEQTVASKPIVGKTKTLAASISVKAFKFLDIQKVGLQCTATLCRDAADCVVVRRVLMYFIFIKK